MKWILSILLIVLKFSASNAASCDTKFSDASFIRSFGFSAASETTKNKGSELFTVGWCSSSTQNGSPNIDVDFTQSYGISAILVSGPTNGDGDPYPTNVLVKYVPNGGDVNNFVNFPLQGGKLEIMMNQPGTVQSNFGQSIAVRKLQFTIQSYHGDSCLKIDLLGCPLNEVCLGGCLNNGICVMQDTCQCAPGYLGNNCEQKECRPENLGLSTGVIGVDAITVSSQDPTYNKDELGNSDSNKGWCPVTSDLHPWVQVKLDQPKAVSVLSFMWSNKGNGDIMTEFDLQYTSPYDPSRRFRTFATEIPAQNSTHVFTVTISPAIVSDTIRIIPSKWIGRACFKLEMKGCDPKYLCSYGWCQNGGTCMGENVCICARGFVGRRCSLQVDQIQMTNMTFVGRENNHISTSNSTIQFIAYGNVHLNDTDNVLTIIDNNSCIRLDRTNISPSCLTNINYCTDGFTFALDLKFDTLPDDTPILSSGGQHSGISGVSLSYKNKQLTYIVSTMTQKWTLSVNYEPVFHKWNHFELSWSKFLGLEIKINGQMLGSVSRPNSHHGASRTDDLSIWCTLSNVKNQLQITNFYMWPLDSIYLFNAAVQHSTSTVIPFHSYTTPRHTTIIDGTAMPTTTNRVTPSTMMTSATTFRTSAHSTNTLTASSVISTIASNKAYNLDDAINAQCTSYRWNISLDLHILQLLYPGIKPSDVFMSSEKCKGTVHDNKLWFEQNFNTCQTSEQISEGKHEYSNKLFYASFDPNDQSILMRHVWTFELACYVTNGETISSHLSHEVDIHAKNITAHHDISLTFFKDQNFLQRIQGNPLRVTVGDNIYVKVETSIPDLNTKFFIHAILSHPILPLLNIF